MNFIPANENNYEKGRRGKNIEFIIIHSIVGSAQSAIATFQSPVRQVSAHFVVAWNGEVTQMVHDEDTAYHAGVFDINLRSLGIEHDDQGNPDITRPDAVYEASAHLVADKCKTYGIPCDRDHIKMHREIKATACPGKLDIDRIVTRAREILNEIPSHEYPVGTVQADAGLNVRLAPSLNSAIQAKLNKGQQFSVEDVVTGDPVLNNNQWFKVVGKSWFVWSGGVSVSTPQPPAPAQASSDQIKKNALQILTNALPILRSKNGQLFGNEEGMAREMTESWNEYLQLKAIKDANGGLIDKLAHALGLA